MTTEVGTLFQDIMQVCRNGHVVTDRMRTCSERSRYHCERCGATTLHACATCGQEIAGAVIVPGLDPVGTPKPPLFCSRCGGAFPWRRRINKITTPLAVTLETFLRRLPLTIRQLRQRFGTRPAFQLADEHDLEDLVRALLPLYFDDVRLRSRTPAYTADTRTDFLLPALGLVLVVKHVTSSLRQAALEQEQKEDAGHYRDSPECHRLWIYIFDPQACLHESEQLESLWSQQEESFEVRCVIGR